VFYSFLDAKELLLTHETCGNLQFQHKQKVTTHV